MYIYVVVDWADEHTAGLHVASAAAPAPAWPDNASFGIRALCLCGGGGGGGEGACVLKYTHAHGVLNVDMVVDV